MSYAQIGLDENQIAKVIVDSAIQVHKQLGPGLFESVYEVVLAHELAQRGLACERQVPIPITYGAVLFEEGFRADILVEGKVLIEVKSIEETAPIHRKQVLTYLRLTNRRLGLLINFGEEYLKDGITRLVNNLPE